MFKKQRFEKRSVKKQQAFTLIELMVTLAVLGIAMGIAIPSFNTQILNNRSVALGEDFALALNLARSEAVKRSTRVSVCASTDGATCNGAANNWRGGFIAVVDRAPADNTPAPQLTDVANPVAVVLRVWPAQNAQADIQVTAAGNAISFIRYTGLGTLARVTNNPITIDAEMTHCSGDAGRTITIGLAGLVGVKRKTCN